MTTSPLVRLSSGAGDTQVVLSRPFRPFADEVLDVHVLVSGTGLTAHSWVRTVDGDGLTSFADDLVRDFRGWAGTRTWRSLEGDLRVDAQHAGNRVRLDVRLAPGDGRDGWATTATIPIAPGEDLTRLAAGLAELVAAPGAG